MSGPGHGGRPVGEDDLHAYVDGRLPPGRREDVERYLAANPDIASRVSGWADGSARLRQALAARAQAPIPASLDIRRLAAARMARRWSLPAVAASCALTLALGAGAGWTLRGGGDQGAGVTAIAREALVAHRIVAEGDTMPQRAEWASARPAELMTAPDLTAAGYRLVQRQVMATEEGAGSVFLYQDGSGNRISVFVRPMRRAGISAAMEPMNDAPGFAWAKDGMGVGLVSSSPVPTLHGIANEVWRQVKS